ncbi:hypothetical protein [Streptomyces acidicola]|uniref:hypothetical protein n=1 Tax=Streptomyces acidicola TaxID=2596892 RepID=UPI0037F441ED
MRRVLKRIDGDALDLAIGSWLAPDRPTARHPVIPSSRQDPVARPRRFPGRGRQDDEGARRSDGTQVHLHAALTATGLVTAHREVDGNINEITVFRPIFAGLDLADTAVASNALHSQVAHASFLVEDKKAHYIADDKHPDQTARLTPSTVH